MTLCYEHSGLYAWITYKTQIRENCKWSIARLTSSAPPAYSNTQHTEKAPLRAKPLDVLLLKCKFLAQ